MKPIVGRYGPVPDEERHAPLHTALGFYMEATGHRPLAAMLLQYVATRLHFRSRIVERDGATWVMAAKSYTARRLGMRCSQVRTAERELLKLGLVSKRVLASSANVPRTHYALTTRGEEAVANIATGLGVGNRQVHLPDSDKCTVRNSTSACVKHKPESKNRYEKESEERVSLAPSRERREPESRKRRQTEEGEPCKEGPRRHIQRLWLDAHKKHRPDLPCSLFTGLKWKLAQDVAEALGEEAETVIDAVVADWEEFTYYLQSSVGAQKISLEPELVILAIHADPAKRFVAEMEVREEYAERWAHPVY